MTMHWTTATGQGRALRLGSAPTARADHDEGRAAGATRLPSLVPGRQATAPAEAPDERAGGRLPRGDVADGRPPDDAGMLRLRRVDRV